MSSFDILCLRSLIASAQEDYECPTILRVINAVTRTIVDPQFANPLADTLPVTKESNLPAVEARPCTRDRIPEIREPLSHRRLAVDSLVLADLHLRIVA